MSAQPPDVDVNALMRGLVHELRNPLSAILTASQLLNSGSELDEETTLLLDVVQKESRRMNRILTEFSSFVKPPKAHPEEFNLSELLHNMVSDFQSKETFPNYIKVLLNIPDSLLVFADKVQTHQALQHIFCNAAEAMERGGTFRLSAGVEGDQTKLCIEDTGAGFGQSALEHAFQPFFSTKSASVGLGLSIARSLLRTADGELLIQNLSASSPCASGHNIPKEHGARVIVHLPTSLHGNKAASESHLKETETVLS